MIDKPKRISWDEWCEYAGIEIPETVNHSLVEASFKRNNDLINYLEKENMELRDQLKDCSDSCDKCGCSEFLCGHNKKA